MESTQASMQVGMAQRAVSFALALLATSLIFTSVPVVFTAGAGEAVAGGQMAASQVTSKDATYGA